MQKPSKDKCIIAYGCGVFIFLCVLFIPPGRSEIPNDAVALVHEVINNTWNEPT
ncbi:hypothetical protein L209DRAFT_748214 [Thermothelomyces heterothallicus CBS 203.75]